jgi:TonB family protein
VGTDQVRVTSLGSAKSDTVYTDPYGRKWQERVWAVPFLDAYLVGVLLPTPEGYAGIILFALSASLQESKEVGHLLAAQLDVSYRGDLAQWQAALRRRALLPSALSQVKLEKTSAWTLQTPRFVSSITSDMLSLTNKSPLALTMGFMSDGPQTVWDIQGVRWDQDNRKDVAVEVWRRMRPPSGAKLELRNRFDSIRQRRSPFDGSLSRDTVDTLSASSVVDVPGKRNDTVSSDLEYGVTVHLVGRPSASDAAASIARAAAATRVLEHGVGEDVAQVQRQAAPPQPAAIRAVDPDATLDELERKVSDLVAAVGNTTGKDIRGRLLSEDFHEYMQTLRKQLPGIAAKSSDAEKAAWIEEQKLRLKWLQGYRKEYPALTHNRDMFDDFLAKNHMPGLVPHGTAVMIAESALLAALNSGQPAEDWAQNAHALREAYVLERSTLVKNGRSPTPAEIHYSSRASRCPPAATATTGTAHPRVASNIQSLENYWPLESKRLGEEGTVIAALRIDPTGCVTAMAIVGSSGSDMLDNAVLKYLESAEFVPAGPEGKAVKSEVRIPIVFKLQQ